MFTKQIRQQFLSEDIYVRFPAPDDDAAVRIESPSSLRL